MKNILDRELILRKFTPRWVPISYRSNKNWAEWRNPKVCWPT
jgi:hypothetical protein